MNPLEMIKSFMTKGARPEQIIQNMMQNTNNPMFNNLIQKAKAGDTKDVENFARNIMKEQGRDFDKEFAQFRNNLKF